MVGGGEEGIPPSHPGTMGGHTTPWYTGQPPIPGSTLHTAGCTGWSAPLLRAGCCSVSRH